MIRRTFAVVLAIVGATPLAAALPLGSRAPDFTTTGAVAGREFKLNLRAQLKRGPVVLYFFPKAFTKGCTLEARAFSEAMGEFHKAGAEVIGMSNDDLPTLKKFSAQECRNAFPVASATGGAAKAYDVAWAEHPGLTKRTSYVIARNGRVVMVHDDSDWSQHVAKSLAAVRALKR